jgi:2-polyprenyl-6-methoxyphenol hydroxylase-like FAD-dependent oxidoreductase
VKTVKPISIIGGGLAGLTLGIGLRRLNVPVIIWEAGHYPRHRVCGEFISGRGQNILRRLSLLEEFRRAGATLAGSAKFFLGQAESPVRAVAPPALCLSRFTMDRLLAELFREEGGDLRENTRWEGETNREGLVLTSGRRVQPTENGWRWFGLKVHARGLRLTADLEMHGLHQGYVGLCRLSDVEVNVCGLFRARSSVHGSAMSAKELLRGVPGTPLHERLATASFDEPSFCSVAGLSLRPQRAGNQAECRLGDALTMIPPVTGNGMSMAFEAAEIALEPIAAYAQGKVSWTESRRAISSACDKTFGPRLAWAMWLQKMMFSPVLQGGLGGFVLSSSWLWRRMFARTR